MDRKGELERLGGADEFVTDFTEVPSFDKVDHLNRFIANQPNHLNHLRGRNSIRGPQLEQPDPETHGRIFEDWLRSHLPIINSRNYKGGS